MIREVRARILGENPRSGGSPPRERISNRAGMIVRVGGLIGGRSWWIEKILFFSKMSINGVSVKEYIKK